MPPPRFLAPDQERLAAEIRRQRSRRFRLAAGALLLGEVVWLAVLEVGGALSAWSTPERVIFYTVSLASAGIGVFLLHRFLVGR